MICCDRFFIFLSLATLAPHQPFQNRTIPRKPPTLLPYERSVGFASLRNSGRSTSGIHARPLSKVRCCRQKEFGRLPEGLPQLHRPSPSPQPLQKNNNPSPCTTTLASLVKGRWLDGTTQTVALLRPTCDMSALFILQTFQPSRRRDCLSCIDPLHPHNHCKKTIVPCSALNLPPLSKVRCRRPKEFGRLPEGLSHQPFTPHQPFKNRTIPRSAPHSRLPCQREVA